MRLHRNEILSGQISQQSRRSDTKNIYRVFHATGLEEPKMIYSKTQTGSALVTSQSRGVRLSGRVRRRQ